ncbi:MAG TPA: hypothetical protein VMU01_12275 [Rhizomicrobium sp.]|nr:hypothetical protein [Rhizomicrobium sp.]
MVEHLTVQSKRTGGKPITRGHGKAGSRSGKPAFKKRSGRAVRHLSKQTLDEVALETDDRAEARLADQIYRVAHPEPLIEAIVLSSKPGKKKRSPKDVQTAKKRAAEALMKEFEDKARQKSKRKAKRRASARALQKARKA